MGTAAGTSPSTVHRRRGQGELETWIDQGRWEEHEPLDDGLPLFFLLCAPGDRLERMHGRLDVVDIELA
jgi:hypothetical protein